jgi:hypothetical protein
MTVWTVVLNKQTLQGVPEPEFMLFTKLAHFSNESLALMKSMLWARQSTGSTSEETGAQTVLGLMWMRLLCGSLSEAYQLLQTGYFGSCLSKAYQASLPQSAVEALDNLNRYFNGNNAIKTIRDRFAFHYSPEADEQIKSALSEAEDEELQVLISDTDGSNNLYYFAEVLINRAMLARLGGSLDSRLTQLQDEVLKIAGQLRQVCDHLLSAFVARQGVSLWRGPADKASFGAVPAFLEVHTPWFTEPPEPPIEPGADGDSK